jgi:glycosyltransferase involved in cell wall biosynthesis
VKISAVIIAFNEELKIADAVRSVAWADEILVVDSESTDDTRRIAESLGARVLIQKWQGFSAQKQFAVDQAAHDWIFSLDADEQVSDKLCREILEIKNRSDETQAGGYRVPRLSFYMDRPIRHGGWYPDWQMRLFDRRRGKWKDVLIHESFELEANAKIEKLSGDILHYSWESAAQHESMIGEIRPARRTAEFLKGQTNVSAQDRRRRIDRLFSSLYPKSRFSRRFRRFLHRPLRRPSRLSQTSAAVGAAARIGKRE